MAWHGACRVAFEQKGLHLPQKSIQERDAGSDDTGKVPVPKKWMSQAGTNHCTSHQRDSLGTAPGPQQEPVKHLDVMKRQDSRRTIIQLFCLKGSEVSPGC